MLLSFFNSLTSDSIVIDYCGDVMELYSSTGKEARDQCLVSQIKQLGTYTESVKLLYGKPYCFFLHKSVGRFGKGVEAVQDPEVLSIFQNLCHLGWPQIPP